MTRFPRDFRDVAVAAVVATAMAVEGLARGHAGWAPVLGLSVLAAAPLLWHRARPVAALLGTTAGIVVALAVFHPYDTAIAPVLVALYSVARLGDRRRSLVAGVAVSVLVVAAIGVIEHHDGWLAQFAARAALVVAALVLGDTVRTRTALAEAQRLRAVQLEHEREETARRMAADERVRIARDLHDTIAHALVAINVQAGVAAHLGDTVDRQTALTDIKAVSAEALGELRATLGLLRSPGDGAPTAPILTLDAVEQIVGRAQAAGLEAHVDIDMGGHTVPSPVGQAGFRIVQESVTNVLRHAQAQAASIALRIVDGALCIEVTDDGAAGDLAPQTTGHGVQGMRERALALGGSLEAGPRPAGGWQVSARLPLTSEQDR